MLLAIGHAAYWRAGRVLPFSTLEVTGASTSGSGAVLTAAVVFEAATAASGAYEGTATTREGT